MTQINAIDTGHEELIVRRWFEIRRINYLVCLAWCSIRLLWYSLSDMLIG